MEKNLYKRLGILRHQQSRLQFMWSLRFFYQVGFVFSWTVLIALFVGSFGVENLIYFFLIDAGLFLLGSLLSTSLFLRMNLDKFLFGTVLAACMGLVVSLFFKDQMALFLTAILIVKNFFYAPMNVAIYRKNESLLSPDEARHVMPILDSAVTIGTIIASLCLLLLISSMSLVDLMFLWILPLFAIGFLVVHSKSIIRDIPRIELQKIKQSEKTHWIYALSFIGKTKFLSLMLVMVLFQSALWTTSDFVFTHWLQEHVPQQVAEPLMGNLQSNIFIDSVQQVGHIIEEVSSNMFVHESLVHYLGWFSLLFGIIALVVQLVLASKLLERLGVIGTMMSFFGSFGLMVFALITGQFNMNWVRGVQHGFHSFFEVGYHLTYYSIESPYREVVRHFFEAIIKPLGVIFCLGTVWVFSRLGFDAIAVSYYILLILALALVGLLYLMRKPYTEMTKKSFYQDSSIATKLHIAEILSHEGHSRAVHILGASVIDKDANIFVREKAIEQITLVGDPSIFQLYVRILEDETESTDIKIKVLESLMGIKALRKYLKENPFSRYKLVEILEALYLNPSHGHIRKLALMNLFAHMPPYDLVPFFLEKVQTQDVYLKCICLRSVAEIFEDPAMVVYTESFLENPHPRIKGHAIIALWKFYDKDKLRGILETLLSDDEEAEIIAAIYAIGEIKDIKSLPAITRYLAHDSLEVRMHVLVAMAKLEDYRCLNCMMAILFGDNEASAQDMFNMIRRTSPDFQSRLRQEVQYRVSAEVMSVLEYAEIDESGGTLSLAVLGRLKHLYRLAGRFGDLWSLEQITPKAT